MFIYESTNYKTLTTDSITGKYVYQLCTTILNYSNDEDDQKEYYVRFYDFEGNILNEFTESSLLYAINGDDENVSEEVKDECQLFWDMIPWNVEIIKFENPIRSGYAIWNKNYKQDEEDSDAEEK